MVLWASLCFHQCTCPADLHPLPLAVDNADFTEQSSLGIRVGFNRTCSRISCCSSIVTSLFSSVPNASLITSFLRSNLSAPCGVILRHPSSRTLQRSALGLRPCVVFDRTAPRAFNSGSEFVDVFLGDSFPLNSCSLKLQWKNWDRVHSDFWSVHCSSANLTPTRGHEPLDHDQR